MSSVVVIEFFFQVSRHLAVIPKPGHLSSEIAYTSEFATGTLSSFATFSFDRSGATVKMKDPK
jgi:hypothetical protein